MFKREFKFTTSSFLNSKENEWDFSPRGHMLFIFISLMNFIHFDKMYIIKPNQTFWLMKYY